MDMLNKNTLLYWIKKAFGLLSGHQAEKKENKTIVKTRLSLFMLLLIWVSILVVIVVAVAVVAVTDPRTN